MVLAQPKQTLILRGQPLMHRKIQNRIEPLARYALMLACLLFLLPLLSLANDLPDFNARFSISSNKETVTADQASQYYWSDRYREMTVVCKPDSGGSVDFEINMESRVNIIASPNDGWVKAAVGATDETIAYLVEGQISAVRCYANSSDATLWIRAR